MRTQLGFPRAWARPLNAALLIATTIVLTASISSASTIGSTFQTGTDGWKLVAEYLNGTTQLFDPNFVPLGGVQSGYLWTWDPLPASRTYWSAPDRFLGDQSGLFGGNLVFHLMQTTLDKPLKTEAPEYAGPDVILEGGGITIYAAIADPGTSWTAYSLAFASGTWKKMGDNSVASDAEIQQVLASLDKMWIKGEYSYRAGDPATNGGYPNGDAFALSLVHVPDPLTVSLLAFGGGCLLARRSSRKAAV
jgi:hypothetical protein